MTVGQPEAVLLMPFTTGACPWGSWQAGMPTYFPASEAPGLLAAHVARQLTPAEQQLVEKGRLKPNRALVRQAARKARAGASGPKPDANVPPGPPASAMAPKGGQTKGPKRGGRGDKAAGAAMPPPFPGPGGEL
jgi:hypothetical protein